MNWWLILVLHIMACIISYVLIKGNILYTKSLIMPMVVLVPFWGVISLVVEEVNIRRKRQGTKEIGIEKMKLLDKKYKQIFVETDENQVITVPLEEAILINDTKTRRSLMLDILHKNPDEYVEMLQRTRLSNDVELTHYATTTIMEIQSDYEKQIQKYDVRLKLNPDDEDTMNKYLDLLLKYIKSGLISGNILLIQRAQVKNLLKNILVLHPYNKRIYLLYIENELELKQYDDLANMLQTAKKKWPEEEKVYILHVNYYRNSGQGQEIQKILKEIKEKNIYLSREGKEWYRFWSKEV